MTLTIGKASPACILVCLASRILQTEKGLKGFESAKTGRKYRLFDCDYHHKGLNNRSPHERIPLQRFGSIVFRVDDRYVSGE